MKIFVKSLLLFFFITQLINSQDKKFNSDVETIIKPWNHLDFYNDPLNFQFAIVSDRTGGNRKGIFKDAVDKLNLILPEMVLSVGDLIEGYTKDTDQLDLEWKEFNGLVKELEMPFFYLPGNHDISNKVMQKEWENRFGTRYYHFLYKDVLFLLMDTNDGDGVDFTDEQINYFLEVIKENKNVRWTFIFMHHPIWEYKNASSFENIEKELTPSQYTVFAGHTHHYMHTHKNESNYYVLATTGGGSKLRGPGFGEFDHITWVTMTDGGPRLANIKLDGIISHDVVNPQKGNLAKELVKNSNFDNIVLVSDTTIFKQGTIYLRFFNNSVDTLNLFAQVNHNHQINISKSVFDVDILPNSEKIIEIPISSSYGMKFENLEPLSLNWTMKFSQNTVIKLDGKTNISISPTIPNTILNKYNVFVDELDITVDKKFNSLTYNTFINENKMLVNDVNKFTINESSTISVSITNEKCEISKYERRKFLKNVLTPGIKLNHFSTGLEYKYYEGRWKMMPKFEELNSIREGHIEILDLELIETAKDYYGIVFEGYIKIEEDALYEFFTHSDDGSKLFVDEKLVVNNDGSHSAKTEYSAIGLSKGFHPIRIEYFEDYASEELKIGIRNFNGKDEFKTPSFYHTN